MTIKAHEFDRVVKKFEFKTRDSGDLLAWFEYKGKIITRTRRSKGSGELPMQYSIRQQMKLNEKQLNDAIKCIINKQDYIKILKGKGLI
ncbi:MAG: hypothetical protein ABR954_00085 [Dehalococcoidales bacterium]